MTQKAKVKSHLAATASPQAIPTAAFGAEERDRRLYGAVRAFQAGRYAEAEAEARALKQICGYFPAVLLLGMIAAKTSRAQEAIELLREAIGLDHRSLEAHNELATVLRSQGRNEQAIAAAKQAVRLKPADPGSHHNLALCYLAADRVPLAITHLERAIALKPDAAMFHHNLGLALQRHSHELAAIEAFRRSLALDATNVEALSRLGQLLMKHGSGAEAAQCYERAAGLQPDGATAAVHRAEVFLQQGRIEDAEGCLRAALESAPESDLLHQVLGVLLQRTGRFEDAAVSLQRAIELQPRRISAYVSLVRGKRIGPSDAALLAAIQALLRERSIPANDRISLHYTLGKAYDDLGDYKQAITQFDRANELAAARMRAEGRWFDRRAHRAFVDQAIARFSAEGLARQPPSGSESALPIFIVGMPRSGTTLIEQILSSHPQIGAAGELSYWTDRRSLVAQVPESAAALQQLAEDYLVRLSAASPSSLLVTDKMPANFLVLGLIHLVLPRARIIHCGRHPVDTCLSIWSTPLGNPLDFVHERANLVFYYEQYARLMEHWRRVIPADRFLEVDYEALVADPERATRTMLEFCGVPWDAACLQHERNRHLIMTPSLWQARQPIYRDALERWRRYEPWLGPFKRLLQSGQL